MQTPCRSATSKTISNTVSSDKIKHIPDIEIETIQELVVVLQFLDLQLRQLKNRQVISSLDLMGFKRADLVVQTTIVIDRSKYLHNRKIST